MTRASTSDEPNFDSSAAVAAFAAENGRARFHAAYWAAAPDDSRRWIEAWYREQPGGAPPGVKPKP